MTEISEFIEMVEALQPFIPKVSISAEILKNLADELKEAQMKLGKSTEEVIVGHQHQYNWERNLASKVGSAVPLMVNPETGAVQAKVAHRVDLIDPATVLDMAEILGEGVRSHGLWNWRLIPIDEQLNHAMIHILAWLAGDRSDNHLGHAMCRVMFARSLELDPDVNNPRMFPHSVEVPNEE